MADTATTAGTVVAAVLEGSGYYSHAQILDTFQTFFQAGGTFIFVAACVVGIFLSVLYGNFKPMLPLVIGPALFFFLTDFRAPLDPPVKKLGGGTAVDVSPALAGSNTYAQNLQPAQVSWFFRITTRLSSQVVNYVTDLIMRTEDNQEVLFMAQKSALSAILESEPSRSELQNMISFTMLDSCSPMLSALYNLSGEEFSDDHEAVLNQLATGGGDQAASAQAALADLDNRRQAWDDLFTNSATLTNITPSQAMKDFISRETSMFVNTGAGIDYSSTIAPRGFAGSPQQFITDVVPNIHITCGQAMNVFGDAALVQGTWLDQFIVPGTLEQGLNDTPANREMICRSISDKIFKSYTYTAPCQLGGIAMLYLVRNLFSSSALSASAQQIIDRSQTTNSSLTDKCRDPDRPADTDELCRTIDITQANPAWAGITQQNADDVDSVTGNKLSLKTSITSYAYNIPYYQGLLLYFIAAMYPFWCILVLIPSRAGAFFYLPLAWFWVKSWDIGFSLVYVLDELLWNILPSPKLLQNGYKTYGDLPDLLRNMAGADLGYDLLAHYYFVGMCLTSVPLLTGYAILRGRSEALSVLYRAPAISSGLDGGQIDQLEYNSARDLGTAYNNGELQQFQISDPQYNATQQPNTQRPALTQSPGNAGTAARLPNQNSAPPG